MKYLLTIGLTLIFVACGKKSNTENSVKNKDSVTQTSQENNESIVSQKQDSVMIQQDSIANQKENIKMIHKSDFEKFLKDPKTPKMAIELYHNTFKLKEGDPIELLENLESKDTLKRWFYFRVITNSYKISDGAYAEGLCNIAKEYIENNTCEFASYFDNKECFNDKDLDIWASMAMSEFAIIGEIERNKYDKTIVDKYNKKLKENCKSATKNQQETINKFCKQLKNNWIEFLKHTDE